MSRNIFPFFALILVGVFCQSSDTVCTSKGGLVCDSSYFYQGEQITGCNLQVQEEPNIYYCISGGTVDICEVQSNPPECFQSSSPIPSPSVQTNTICKTIQGFTCDSSYIYKGERYNNCELLLQDNGHCEVGGIPYECDNQNSSPECFAAGQVQGQSTSPNLGNVAPAPSPDNNSNTSGNSLSGGAIAGIVIAVLFVVVVIIVTLAILYYLLVVKKQGQEQEVHDLENEVAQQDIHNTQNDDSAQNGQNQPKKVAAEVEVPKAFL
eukprot:TRINITY_DN2131_c0_g1_i3.p2 TRINITY_DN2131_c0_g1~~TRINITY_DN2131_c0_g1_i3.p2  ORF type:complete len:265 (+),score=23.26 TRINITY_DN2131_c0_g1_i3:172-966(+)